MSGGRGSRVIHLVLLLITMSTSSRLSFFSSVFDTVRQKEGAGFYVRRAIGKHLDPFLMLDHMGPTKYGPREAVGAPDHPHRGFQTVTYVIEGQFEHLDSTGHQGVLSEGDVQWMNAGSGVIHSETPSKAFFESGGVMEGFQLWVNVPRKWKMSPPDYQEYPAASIPKYTQADGVDVRVIAGEHRNTSAAIRTLSPIMYLDVRLQPGRHESFRIPPKQQGLVYIYRGSGLVSNEHLVLGKCALIGASEQERQLEASAEENQELRFLLITGTPIGEPVVQYGPFVMNTQEEIQQAFRDYQSGRLAPPMHGAEERIRQAQEAVARQRGEL